MKRWTMYTLVAAAAMTAVASGISAQSMAQTMKAEIPFTFQAGGATLTPGSYTVKIDHGAGSAHFTLRNLDTGKSAMLVQSVQGLAPRHWRADGQPRLGFECVGSHCALRNIWSGADTRAYYLPGPKLGREEASQQAEIALTKAN